VFTVLTLGICSLLFSLVLTPILRDTFLRLRILDIPDDRRKLHDRPIPRVGGIAILISYLGAFAALLLFSGGRVFSDNRQFVWSLLPATGIVALTGLLDDLKGLRPWQKLTGQLAGASWAYWTGIRITGIGGIATENWWCFPLTILWLAGCTNAFNLIDGVDGLASGVGLFATSTTLLAALLQHNVGLVIATAPLAGALLGFLPYNFSPASIFLGDSGSLVIGFLLGCYGVIWSQKSATLLGMLAPVMAVSIPLLEVGLSIVRRFLSDKPIFEADRGHIHHRLLARGLTPRSVALILYGICGVAAILSLLQSVLYNHVGGLIIILFCGLTLFGVQSLGYVEFGVVGRMLAGGDLRRILRDEIFLRNVEEDLRRSKNFFEWWQSACEACREMGFHEVRLRFGGETYMACFAVDPPEAAWQIRVALGESDYLNLARDFRDARPVAVAPFLEMLRSSLDATAKLEQTRHHSHVTAP
jgi:UDP-GlcNAc:undecaprenyl-phosphate/decaprenyl-phosphate GlcNAc-1-phosphate transferase